MVFTIKLTSWNWSEYLCALCTIKFADETSLFSIDLIAGEIMTHLRLQIKQVEKRQQTAP